jgi:hypothetical protein
VKEQILSSGLIMFGRIRSVPAKNQTKPFKKKVGVEECCLLGSDDAV